MPLIKEKSYIGAHSNQSEVDLEWVRVVDEVNSRDVGCRVLQCIDIIDWKKARDFLRLSPFHMIMDHAHIFGRATSPRLKYDSRNVVKMYRGFHERFDRYQDPITGKPIGKEGRILWCIRILGKDIYNILKEVDNGR